MCRCRCAHSLCVQGEVWVNLATFAHSIPFLVASMYSDLQAECLKAANPAGYPPSFTNWSLIKWGSSAQWGLELDEAGRPYRRVYRRVTDVPPKPQLVPQYG